jgi:FG-GAP-like repeat
VFMWRDSDKSWMVNLSTGTGFIAQQWSGAWGSDGPISTGDLNGDGKTDVFMWRDFDKSWMINLSTGKGFDAKQWDGAWDGGVTQIIVGDFNGDHKSDVLIYETDYNPMENNISTGSAFNRQAWRWTNPPPPHPVLCLGQACSAGQICTEDACCQREDVYDVTFPEPGQPNNCTGVLPGGNVVAAGCACRNPSDYGKCLRAGRTPCGSSCCPFGFTGCRQVSGSFYCSLF